MPRPKVPKDKKLSERSFTLLSPAERKRLERHAKKLRSTRSKILRAAFLYWESRQKNAA